MVSMESACKLLGDILDLNSALCIVQYRNIEVSVCTAYYLKQAMVILPKLPLMVLNKVCQLSVIKVLKIYVKVNNSMLS